MAGRSVANRSEAVTVSTPRGRPVEVVRQQRRSERPGSRWKWEWLVRPSASATGGRGTIDREAIRQAVLLRPASSRSGCWTRQIVASAELEVL